MIAMLLPYLNIQRSNIMDMPLSKALRHKKRLVEKIRACTNLIENNNTLIVGNDGDCDVTGELAQRRELSVKLVGVKIAIENGSRPIRWQILRLSEIKDEITMLRGLKCVRGKSQVHFSTSVEEYDCVISDADRRAMINNLETEIDDLQEQVDSFNARTIVTL